MNTIPPEIITLNQLTKSSNGVGVLKAMIGAKNFAKSEEHKTIAFRFMNGAANKANHIKIKLAGNDTYTVTFIRIWGTKITNVSTHRGIYNDMLKGLFESETALFLTI